MSNKTWNKIVNDASIDNAYTYLVSGDSISRGIIFDEQKGMYSVSPNGFVALVQKRIKGLVRNVSRFGNTLARGIGRLGRDLEKDHPHIVLIEYGGNDCDFSWAEVAAHPELAHEPQTELSRFEEMLSDAILTLKDSDIVPVLMTLPPLNADDYIKWVSKRDPVMEGNILKWLGSVTKIYWWQERYSSSIVGIAEKTNTRWIDIRRAFLRRPDFNSLICRDGIHPNEEGHALIADTIVGYISENGPYMLSDRAAEGTA